ncbi:energy transducer TonB [uncultured Shewanella sp.]|uniref:energy transducer TonB n=1 Tax=uncultured Shewanella sp. TaxID=173975 RepID=UPI0026352EAF|nr:energy transducer TonB [uncultured Shewanella sp.]
MSKVVTLSICSLFLVACVSNDAVEVVTEEPIQYINFTSNDQKDRVQEYWVVEKRQNPKYPISAARKGLSGCVDFIVGIKKDGRAVSYQAKKSYPEGLFDEYAAAALNHWKWSATEENGEHLPVLTTIQLDFMVGGAKNKRTAEKVCGFSHI